MIGLIAEEENWIILNWKTGHGPFHEIQNLAIAEPENTKMSTC